MAMQITMLQTRMGEAGALLSAGATYTVSEAYGTAMIGAGFASDTNRALTPPTSSLNPTQAAAVAASLAGPGSAAKTWDGQRPPRAGANNSPGQLVTRFVTAALTNNSGANLTLTDVSGWDGIAVDPLSGMAPPSAASWALPSLAASPTLTTPPAW